MEELLNFQPYNFLAGIIFGTLGLGLWRYGSQMDCTYPRVLGILLMVYPYFISNAILLWVVGVVLLVLAWIKRHE
ncbi:MAG TPA: hypothetical protein VFY13_02180 [Luteolibacter sp.]|nr:hypothetical protein [Luteolibacter sp.]